eukprot:CAMPEP_0174269368 /NCGR_PEP_ID=MMETSP0439-20130205/40765_1 /TAXON_ID=0 /ORGANISM="Stereomyxa ramosa, Strain Chinc5" /LENGTH=316 /DNA_ID=CAMNT_0015358103 /DNA_START=46 /DNA_END=996 /DNA_ORIENTATION=-
MLRAAEFWQTEKDAPLFNLNKGFIEQNDVFERTENWPDLVIDKSEDLEIDLPDSEAVDRIITADANRTFVGPENKSVLKSVLQYLMSDFGDYAQGMSYATSFLLLTHDAQTAVKMLRQINYNEKYIPGYWKAEAIGFATDSYVFFHLLKKRFPDVHEHFSKLFLLPEMFCQKWFVGLGIHVLPFEALFSFFESFLEHGFTFLFQFGLSYIEHVESRLLETSQHNELFGILRFDANLDWTTEELAKQIVEGAANYEEDVKGVDYKQLREEVFESSGLKARLERAKQRAEESDSDFSFDEFTTDDEDDGGDDDPDESD